jgi:RecB family exonuclease
MSHSKIVGGSSAERVIKCPASVKLAQQMPAQEENDDMREGTRRHELLQAVLEEKVDSRNIDDEKVLAALDLFDNEVDPHGEALFDLEKRVHYIWNPDVFGTVDMIGVLDKDTAYVLDWKTGDGHQVTAEENYQLLFYAAAALSCDHWAFRDRTFVELIIVQPPVVRRWVTDKARLREFEHELRMALAAAERDTAPHAGEHCKWCPAKIICPAMNGARDRLVKTQLDALPIQAIAAILQDAERVEAVIDAARKAALAVLEKGGQVPGYKLVPKRAQRSWANEQDAKRAIEALGVAESELMDLKSPAQVEKVLKTHKLKLPEGLTVSVSSGDTIAPESDPRTAKVLIGQQLTAALSKLV